VKLRQHQQELKDLISRPAVPPNVLMHVVPGGGKSLLPGLLLERYPNYKIAWFVPRLSLRRQAALGLKRVFGFDVHEVDEKTYVNPSKGTRGFIATHQSLLTNLSMFNAELERYKYIVIVDELHHAKTGVYGDEPNATARALANLVDVPVMYMTGTLDTNDNQRVYGIPYRYSAGVGHVIDTNGFDGSVIRYTREKALSEGAIVPITFEYHDGDVSWKDGAKEPTMKLSQATKQDAGSALFTALSTKFARQLFENAYDKWRLNGDRFLVVVSGQKEAKEYFNLLRSRGVRVGLAIEQNGKEAQSDIEEFRNGELQALVTVQMAYEGLDVPEITHLACLTRIRSVPWIEQMFARAWRAAPGKKVAYAFVPSDVLMMEVVDRIRAEQEAVIREPNEGPDGPRDPKEHEPIIPQFGIVQEIRQAVLDGELMLSPEETALLDLIQQFGLDPASTEVAIMLSTLAKALAKKNSPAQPAVDTRTHADKCRDLRNRIAEYNRDADAAEANRRGVNPVFGRHQAILKQHMGKGVDECTLEELERAYFYATRNFRTA
jgi:superfamily II DNA or RNA helicase